MNEPPLYFLLILSIDSPLRFIVEFSMFGFNNTKDLVAINYINLTDLTVETKRYP